MRLLYETLFIQRSDVHCRAAYRFRIDNGDWNPSTRTAESLIRLVQLNHNLVMYDIPDKVKIYQITIEYSVLMYLTTMNCICHLTKKGAVNLLHYKIVMSNIAFFNCVVRFMLQFWLYFKTECNDDFTINYFNS